AHFRKNEVGGAVDDAGYPLDMIGGEAFADGLDDGDATRHRGLEGHHHTVLARLGEDLVAVLGQQGLVGGDHVLAIGDGLEHQLARHGIAADQFDHDINIRVAHHGECIGLDGDIGADACASPRNVALADAGYGDAAARTAGDFFCVAFQNLVGTATDDAKAQEANAKRFDLFGHAALLSSPSLRNICLMPRTACRIRASFSMRANRTWSSPYSPKPMPGETATLASSSTRLENSSEPRC